MQLRLTAAARPAPLKASAWRVGAAGPDAARPGADRRRGPPARRQLVQPVRAFLSTIQYIGVAVVGTMGLLALWRYVIAPRINKKGPALRAQQRASRAPSAPARRVVRQESFSDSSLDVYVYTRQEVYTSVQPRADDPPPPLWPGQAPPPQKTAGDDSSADAAEAADAGAVIADASEAAASDSLTPREAAGADASPSWLSGATDPFTSSGAGSDASSAGAESSSSWWSDAGDTSSSWGGGGGSYDGYDSGDSGGDSGGGDD